MNVTMRRLISLGLCGAVILSVSACGKKKPTLEPKRVNFPNNAATTTGDGSGTAGSGQWGTSGAPGEAGWGNTGGSNAGGTRGGMRAETMGGELMFEGAPTDALPNVYFAFDKSELDSSATSTLDSNASYLKSNANLYVVLRGHTDDSGTEEYNMALGSQRAQTVREYLIDQGISADRLATVSFGETMKAVEGEDDAARAKNRRVEFFVATLDATNAPAPEGRN